MSCRGRNTAAANPTMEDFEMLRRFTLTVAALALMAVASAPVYAASNADQIVTESQFTVGNMTGNKDFGKYVHDYLADAKGVLIVPNMIRGAFIFGGEGGSGVLLTKNKDGSWSYPAFYTLGGVSWGLQIGGSSSQVMLLLMTDHGVNAVLDGNRITLGADVGIAAGPVGGGAQAGVTLKSADVITYSLSKGAYAGISLAGSYLEPRESLNKEYYGAEVGTKAIIAEHKYTNPQADGLRAALAAAKQAPASMN
jgi:lipid-binding SYLF domain-containing protein